MLLSSSQYKHTHTHTNLYQGGSSRRYGGRADTKKKSFDQEPVQVGALTTEAPKDVDTKSDSMADGSNARENRNKGDYLENLKVSLGITQARCLCIIYFCHSLALVMCLEI